MQRELDVIKARSSWTLVHKTELPDGQQVLPVRWVFTTKPNPDQSIKYKARLIVRGDLQRDRITPQDLYAYTAAITSFRTFIAIAAARGYQIY